MKTLSILFLTFTATNAFAQDPSILQRVVDVNGDNPRIIVSLTCSGIGSAGIGTTENVDAESTYSLEAVPSSANEIFRSEFRSEVNSHTGWAGHQVLLEVVNSANTEYFYVGFQANGGALVDKQASFAETIELFVPTLNRDIRCKVNR